LARFGLEVAEAKTKTLRFGFNGGDHNGRFDFLGFEFYWQRDRKGIPRMKRRTATQKWLAGLQRMAEWIKGCRHESQERIMKMLGAKFRGLWNYYGIRGNYDRMHRFYRLTNRTVFKWLNRRSQRRSLTWPEYARLLQRFQVPEPRIWNKPPGGVPCQMNLSFCQRLADFLQPATLQAAYARASQREEPGAGKLLAGICEGGTEQSVSLPRPPFLRHELQFRTLPDDAWSSITKVAIN
jgi:hypothetical protein